MPCRYDHIYITPELEVVARPEYREDTIWGPLDHALVVADIAV